MDVPTAVNGWATKVENKGATIRAAARDMQDNFAARLAVRGFGFLLAPAASILIDINISLLYLLMAIREEIMREFSGTKNDHAATKFTPTLAASFMFHDAVFMKIVGIINGRDELSAKLSEGDVLRVAERAWSLFTGDPSRDPDFLGDAIHIALIQHEILSCSNADNLANDLLNGYLSDLG
jgi:hypothetical protein